MRCEAKLARIEDINWNAHTEQVQQLDALGGKVGKNLRPLIEMLTQKKFSNLMPFEAKIEKVEAIYWIFTQNKLSKLMRCEAKLTKVEVINWIFTQNKFSNLMRCEAKLAKREAIDWNAYSEKIRRLDALWGNNRKSRGY